jgi:hypothetical protein
MRLYIDGCLQQYNNNYTKGLSILPSDMYIGARFDHTLKANASIDELKIWNSPLTDQEIQLALQTYHYSRRVQGAATFSLSQVVAGSYGTVDLDFVPQETIPAGAAIRFLFKHGNNAWLLPQTTSASEANYAAAYVNGVKAQLNCGYAPSGTGAICEIPAVSSNLYPKAVVKLRLGERGGYNPGYRFPLMAGKGRIDVAVDKGNGYFFEIPSSPDLTISGDKTTSLFVRGRSFAKTGYSYSLVVKTEDCYLNTDSGFTGTIAFSSTDPRATLPAQYTFQPQDKGVHRFTGISFVTPGVQTITVQTTGGTMAMRGDSNPIKVMSSNPTYQLFWGDLHGHTTFSDGIGNIDDYFNFAKNASNLDFVSISDHGALPNADYSNPVFFRHFINSTDWDSIRNKVAVYYQPEAFVTILGYEYSHGRTKDLMSGMGACSDGYFSPSDPNTGLPADNPSTWACYQKPECVNINCPLVQGDWNVYYLNTNGPLFAPQSVSELFDQVSSWKKKNPGPNPQTPSVIVIPHHGGRLALMSLLDLPSVKNDPDLVPGIEIISMHISSPCSFESWVQNGLTRAKLGILASSDDHSGCPGRPAMGSRQGMIAVYASSLTRESIFEAIAKRRYYAYSMGDRSILEFSIDGSGKNYFMGESLLLHVGEKPKINFSITTKKGVGVTKIDIIKNGTVVKTFSYNASVPQTVTGSWEDPSFVSNSYYYVKVSLNNSATIWSSPIWINVY